MQPIRMRTAIEMRLFTSGKASSSSPVLVLKVPIVDQDATHKVYSSLEIESWNRSRGAMTVQTFSSRLSGSFFFFRTDRVLYSWLLCLYCWAKKIAYNDAAICATPLKQGWDVNSNLFIETGQLLGTWPRCTFWKLPWMAFLKTFQLTVNHLVAT